MRLNRAVGMGKVPTAPESLLKVARKRVRFPLISMTPDEFLTWLKGACLLRSKSAAVLRAADVLGVSSTTVWDWMQGRKNVSSGNLHHMETLVRENRLGLVERAEAFARERHEGQVRKFTGDPYFNHPKAVAELAAHYTDDERVLAAAWLHDTMEDCGASYEELAGGFDPYTAALVYLLTNDEDEKKRQGKVKYMVGKISALPPDALMVKLCDMLNNMTETHSKRQSARYADILEAVTLCPPPAWNAVHTELAERIRKANKFL